MLSHSYQQHNRIEL